MTDVTASLAADMPVGIEDKGIAVLNAATSLTMQRTIVEAFVKLVVCRKVTVQQVAAVSGQVLDSRTTQEEDSPVILEVHRHEIGNVLSAFASSGTAPGHLDTHQPCRNVSSPASQKSNAEEKRKRNHHHCDYPVSQTGGISSSNQGLPFEAGVVKKKSASSVSECVERSGHKLDEAARPGSSKRIRREMSNDSQAEIRIQGQSAGRRKAVDSADFCDTHTDGSMASVNCPFNKTVNNIDRPRALSSSTLPYIVCGGLSGDDPGAGVSQGQSVEGLPAADSAIDRCNVKTEHNEAVSGQETMEEEEEPESDLGPSEERPPIPELSCRSHSESPSSQIPRTRAGSLSGQQCEAKDSVDGGSEGTSGDSEGHQGIEGIGSGKNTTQSLSVCNTHTEGVSSAGASSLSLNENDGEERLDSEQRQQLGMVPGTAESHVQISKAVLDCSNIEETQNEETDHPCASPSAGNGTESNHVSEDDAEQDMLVIDISSSVSEPASQTETGDSPDCTGNRATSKPDPFAHLLTSFPPLDRTHSEASHRGQQDRVPGGGTPPVKDGEKESHSTVTVKAEPDDDCMITAAFIFPARKKNCSESRLAVHSLTNPNAVSRSAAIQRVAVSHSATNQNMAFGRGVNPGRSSFSSTSVGQRGRDGLGRAAGMRSQPHFSQMQMPSMHQFHHSALGRETESNSAPDPYQSLSTHNRLGPLVPSSTSSLTSKPYIPNFLASTSQTAEHIAAETVSLPPGMTQGPSPIDYSQQTYQCNLCCKIFLHKHKFERHALMCGGHRPFRCKICSKGFNQRAHLDTHMKFHIGIKRYRCDACRKAYVMKGDLIRHLKTRGHRLTLQTQGLHGVP